MSLTTFSFPTRTLFGAGALKELPAGMAGLGMRRPLVVTDAGLLNTDAFGALANLLGADKKAKDWFIYSGVHPNPIENDVCEAAAAFRDHDCDGVIAIGGGSPLDAGKTARLLLKRPGLNPARVFDEADWSGLAPFIALPATPRTRRESGRPSLCKPGGEES